MPQLTIHKSPRHCMAGHTNTATLPDTATKRRHPVVPAWAQYRHWPRSQPRLSPPTGPSLAPAPRGRCHRVRRGCAAVPAAHVPAAQQAGTATGVLRPEAPGLRTYECMSSHARASVVTQQSEAVIKSPHEGSMTGDQTFKESCHDLVCVPCVDWGT